MDEQTYSVLEIRSDDFMGLIEANTKLRVIRALVETKEYIPNETLKTIIEA